MSDDTLRTGEVRRVPLDTLAPYWRNPRTITAEAVEAVRQSLEKFGYQQPIVVDPDLTIIIGHTRYSALKKLKVSEVDVLVLDYLTEQQVQELRVLDNRVAEYTAWDVGKLMDELAESHDDLLKVIFSDLLGETAVEEIDGPSPDEWEDVDSTVEFICPHCFHHWEQQVTRAQIDLGEIK